MADTPVLWISWVPLKLSRPEVGPSPQRLHCSTWTETSSYLSSHEEPRTGLSKQEVPVNVSEWVSFIKAPIQKQPKCPSSDEWWSLQWHVIWQWKEEKSRYKPKYGWAVNSFCLRERYSHTGPHIMWFHLHEVSRIWKSINLRSRWVGFWGRGRGRRLRVWSLFLGNGNVPEHGDRCSTLKKY